MQGNFAARLRTNIRKSSRSSSIGQTVLQCWYHEDCGDGTVFHDPRRCGTGKIGGRGSSREYTFPRDDPLSEVKGCIRGNTKIGPALEVVDTHHQGRYGIEIMIQSLLNHGTCSWVMIVNEINKYVTEMTEETQDDQAEDHSYIATAAEQQRRENTWVLMLNSSGPNGPMNQRGDYAEAKKICQRLYQESGQAHRRLHPREQVRSRPDQPFAWHDEGLERVDPKTGWKWYDTQKTPSCSSSGWQSSAWWQSSSWSQTFK